MAVYAVGDVQGCFNSLLALLDQIEFRPGQDQLWFAGDLICRGPSSVQVMAWVYQHREHVKMVLGNHDIRLLAIAEGLKHARPEDHLTELLEHPQKELWLAWLVQQPLLYRHGSYVLLHAGLLPQWSFAEAEHLAQGAQRALQGPHKRMLLQQLQQPTPDYSYTSSDPIMHLAQVVRTLTYLRICNGQGDAHFAFSGPPESAPAGYAPWFVWPHQRDPYYTILCGHWSSLGLHQAPGLWALDSGCVWGGHLTAIRLHDQKIFQQPALEPPAQKFKP